MFFHEYGHDLGLPDDYNILSGGDNNNEHWTLMAQSRLGAKDEEFIGDRAGDLGAWNKLQLGWLDYETSSTAGTSRQTMTLGPGEYNTTRTPGRSSWCCRRRRSCTSWVRRPPGAKQWYSGDGQRTSATRMTREVTLGGGTATLTFQARWDIEDCGPDACDYAYVEASTDGGATGPRFPAPSRNPAEGNGIDGTQATYVPATFDLSAYAGKTISLRFRYSTDPAAAGNDADGPDGIFVDDIAVTVGGATVFTDGAETGANGWTLDGLERGGRGDHARSTTTTTSPGTAPTSSYDKYLKSGPYYFGYPNTLPDKVDHYAYQQGLLISYWDTSYADNDTFAHPGSGRNLYVDAHPAPMLRSDGVPWRARIQVYDAPFGSQGRQRSTCTTSVLETIARPGRRGRCSTTPASTGTPSCPTTA